MIGREGAVCSTTDFRLILQDDLYWPPPRPPALPSPPGRQGAHMKGIILAGGSGTRLYPLTQAVSKQLLPVYDKPIVYYPLSTLMLAGIRDILVITTPHDAPLFQQLLQDGRQWGISLHYAVQPAPRGLAEAFIIGRPFISNQLSCLVLGDNIFYGHGMTELQTSAAQRQEGATVFVNKEKDTQRKGKTKFVATWRVSAIVVKPLQPRSNYA